MSIRKLLFHGALLGTALAVAALAPAAGLSHSGKQGSGPASRPHAGSAYTLLHTFTGALNDGGEPIAQVTLGGSGNIFGDTLMGGANSEGTIFELAADGTESLLHSFGGAGDGIQPEGAVIFDANGNMYGTTSKGGASGNGTIWEVAANGTYSLLHSFASSEASLVTGRLAADGQGNLYSAAEQGGANGDGSVFEYSAGGRLIVLHSFDGADGQNPEFSLVMDKSGNLYGVTGAGGTSNAGTVFKITSSGKFTSLYSFTGGSDGDMPYGGLAIDKKGNLYGSTLAGGSDNNGTVFKVSPDGALTTLYRFTDGAAGSAPEGDILLVGKTLYGMARNAGADNDGGVYEVTLAGKEKLLLAFNKKKGYGYSGGVVASGNTLYGTAPLGGASRNGTLFTLTTK